MRKGRYALKGVPFLKFWGQAEARPYLRVAALWPLNLTYRNFKVFFLRQQEFGVLKRQLQLCIRRNSFRRLKTGRLRMPEEKRQLCSRTPRMLRIKKKRVATFDRVIQRIGISKRNAGTPAGILRATRGGGVPKELWPLAA